MMTVDFIEGTPEYLNREFVNQNYRIMQRLYPGKWVVVMDGCVLFTADSDQEMFARTEALGMRRGTYYYRHIEPYVAPIRNANTLGL